MKWQRRAIASMGLLCAAGPVVDAEPQVPSMPDEIVWQWFEGCSVQSRMSVVVTLHGRQLYSGAFAACQRRRRDIPDDDTRRTLVFSFRAKAEIFGPESRALGSPVFEANIWRAGGDPDALILGVSVSTPDRILLNSIHVARADRVTRSLLARGLVITTTAVTPVPGITP